MAIDLTGGGPIPLFVSTTSSGIGVTCEEIRVPPFHRVQIFANVAIFVFNDVADGGTAAAAGLRKAITASQAAQGYVAEVGGPISGAAYATVCIAAQSGTGDAECVLLTPNSRNR